MTRLCVSGALVMVDEKQTMPGRGAYACPDSSCLEHALDNYRGCLNRAFKTGNLKVLANQLRV